MIDFDSQRCATCGHDKNTRKDKQGLCQFPLTDAEYKPGRPCGCKCTFPASEAKGAENQNSSNAAQNSSGVGSESPRPALEKYSLMCPHSMFKRECLGCWSGHAARLESHLRKLQHSTALPIRERIEKAVREHMQHCYQVYKGVPPTVEDWVGGALHYVMWGIERDLPLIDATAPNAPERDAGITTVG